MSLKLEKRFAETTEFFARKSEKHFDLVVFFIKKFHKKYFWMRKKTVLTSRASFIAAYQEIKSGNSKTSFKFAKFHQTVSIRSPPEFSPKNKFYFLRTFHLYTTQTSSIFAGNKREKFYRDNFRVFGIYVHFKT